MENCNFAKVDRATLSYLDIIIRDIDKFRERIKTDPDSEETRREFQNLMTLALGSSDSWQRLYTMSSKSGFSPSSLKRYVTHASSPHPGLYKNFLQTLQEVIREDYVRIETTVLDDERIKAEEKAKIDKEWQELVDRVLHIEPDTRLLNTQAVYQTRLDTEEEFPLQVCFSYPCRGIYDFSDYFPHVCSVCTNDGKEPVHGRVFLNGEDGLLLLPNIIYSRADVKQLVKDLKGFAGLYFAPDETEEEWLSGLDELVATDPFFKTLPDGDSNKVKVYDLNKEKTVWVFC